MAESGEKPLSDAAFDALHAREGQYDPAVLKAARDCFLGPAGSAPQNPETIVELSLGSLKPGSVLRKDVYTESGELVLATGHAISETMLERLRNLNKLRPLKEPLLVAVPAAAEA